MCEAGRIRHHLKHNLWNPKSTIIFVGYQAENTLGRKLIEGADMVTLFGEQIAVKAEIVNLEGFSGHADRDGLVDWISSFETDPTVFLVHGEDDAKRDFAEYLGKTKGISPIVVNGTSEFDLQAGGKAYRQTSGNEPIKIREGEYVSDTVKQSGGTVKHAEAAAPSKGMPAKEAHYQDAPVNGAPENTAPQNDAFDDGIGEEQLENMKKKIWHIKENIGGALDNANIAAGKELSQEQLIKINNIIQEIDADTANLMEAVIEPETVDD